MRRSALVPAAAFAVALAAGGAAVLGVLLLAPGGARAEGGAAATPVSLKIGTLAPRESPWGQVFRVWQKAVKQKTGGTVNLEFYWNGTQGDEDAIVAKMKTGQLDGAAITAVGLGVIHRDTLVLQLPGVFGSWQKLDAARGALRERFEAGFKAAGFTLIGWGDVGMDRLMAHGYAVASPAALKHRR